MSKKNTVLAELPQQEKPDKQNLILLGKTAGQESPHVVSQLRLARVQQMQADIAHLQNELAREWTSIRTDLLLGAKVEKGPLRAWIKCILRLGRREMELPRSKFAKTLMVR